MRARPLRERYQEKVVARAGDNCWDWSGFKFKGYGRIRLGSKSIGAHRASWLIHVGPIPDGLTVLHRCDNPECTNPQHLFLGTNADNNADRDAKGRTARGDRASKSKLSEAVVLRLRAQREVDIAAEARRYGVQEKTIKLARKGATWAHL